MAGPTVRRVQLGGHLRRLREAANMTVVEVAAYLRTSKSRVSAVEGGRNVISHSELIILVRDLYDRAELLDELVVMREEGTKKGWWSAYGLSERMASYIGLEEDAEGIRTVESGEYIPGLLQTESYVRRLCAVEVRLSGEEVEKRVAVRLRRQKRLTGDNPLKLTAIVAEGGLVRCARDPVVNDQLDHLIEVAQWPNVELLVLPFDLGLHAGTAGPFSVLSFPDRMLPDFGHVENVVGGQLVDEDDDVSDLVTIFDELRRLALGPNESLAVIAQLAKHP